MLQFDKIIIPELLPEIEFEVTTKRKHFTKTDDKLLLLGVQEFGSK